MHTTINYNAWSINYILNISVHNQHTYEKKRKHKIFIYLKARCLTFLLKPLITNFVYPHYILYLHGFLLFFFSKETGFFFTNNSYIEIILFRTYIKKVGLHVHHTCIQRVAIPLTLLKVLYPFYMIIYYLLRSNISFWICQHHNKKQ